MLIYFQNIRKNFHSATGSQCSLSRAPTRVTLSVNFINPYVREMPCASHLFLICMACWVLFGRYLHITIQSLWKRRSPNCGVGDTFWYFTSHPYTRKICRRHLILSWCHSSEQFRHSNFWTDRIRKLKSVAIHHFEN